MAPDRPPLATGGRHEATSTGRTTGEEAERATERWIELQATYRGVATSAADEMENKTVLSPDPLAWGQADRPVRWTPRAERRRCEPARSQTSAGSNYSARAAWRLRRGRGEEIARQMSASHAIGLLEPCCVGKSSRNLWPCSFHIQPPSIFLSPSSSTVRFRRLM